MPLQDAKNTKLDQLSPGIPNMSGALDNWMQPMVFVLVQKSNIAFQAVEVGEAIKFMGVIQPFTDRELMLRPEGERSWTWYWVHALPSLKLNTDEVVNYLGKQYRVMGLKNYGIYGYLSYQVIEDYTGAGPTIEATP